MAAISLRRGIRAGFAHAPWSARTWRNTTFVTAGLPVHLAAIAILVAPWVKPTRLFAPVSFTRVTLSVLIPLAVLVVLAPALSAAQRHRFWSLLGADIPRGARAGPQLSWAGLVALARSEATWRQLGYHVAVGPVLAAGGLLTLGTWSAGIALAGVVAFRRLHLASSPLYQPGHKALVLALSLAGVGLLLAAPWVAAMVTWLDTRAATRAARPQPVEGAGAPGRAPRREPRRGGGRGGR